MEAERILDYNYAETDVLDKFIRIKKKNPEDFVDGTLALTDLSLIDGVFAVIGKMLGDETIAVQAYLFLKDRWDFERATEWSMEADRTGEIVAVKPDGEKTISKIIDLLQDLADQMSMKKERSIMPMFKEEKTELKKHSDLQQIYGVEIFATGKWNGDKYTIEDLKEIEKNFIELKNTLQPYVKIGHNENQKLLANDGFPAAGWIERVYVEGDKLLADIVDMPKKIYELIKNKAYKRISSEIYWNLKDASGKIFKRALKAIALLGGDTPAVGSLTDIQALYTKRIYSKKEIEGELKIAEINYYSEQEVNKTMDKIEELTKKVSDLEKSNEEQKKNYEESIANISKEKEDVEKKFSDLQIEVRSKDIKTKVDELISAKKLLPAQKDHAISMYENQDINSKNYAFGSDEDNVTKLFESGAEVVNTDEKSKDEQPKDEKKEVEEKQVAVIKKAKTYEEAKAAILKGDE